jgi:dipeptidase
MYEKRKYFWAIIMAVALFLSLVKFVHLSEPDTIADLWPMEKCTSIMVGKFATVDGSVICTQSQDSGNCGIRLRYNPPKIHKPSDTRVVQLWNEYDKLGIDRSPPVHSGPTIEIPEVEHTFGLVEAVFPFMNENQVAIGESTLGGVRPELAPTKNSDAKLRITDVSRVALERATTAREAIKVMASLMEEHGFNAWRPGVGEYFAVADANEVWCFEFVPVGPNWKKESGEPGVAWCAMRIPDDKFAVNANESIIGEINLDDPDNFMASSNVKSLAIKYGWWDPKSDKPFRWDLAYTGKKANSPRTWRALSMVAPSQNLKPNADGYPNPIKPDKKLSILDIREIHADHFEGTEFDETKGLAAGPFGSPEWPRGTPNQRRSLAVLESDTIIINQCRNWLPNPIGGVMWVGMSGGDITVYVPFYAGISELPKAYATGIRTKFSWDSAFWIFYLVGNWAQLNYHHMIKEIKKVQHALESAELNRQEAIDEEAYAIFQENPDLARKFLTDYCIDNANKVLETWRELAYFLIARYGPGSQFAPFEAPAWWIEELIEKQE